MVLRNRFLMVTQDSHFSVAVVVIFDLEVQVRLFLNLVASTALVQLTLQGDAGVVGPEHLSGEVLHLFFQIVVQPSCVDSVENFIFLLFISQELADTVVGFL
jgi:hypothetical protein